MTKAEIRAACIAIAPDFLCLRRHHPQHGVLWVATCIHQGGVLELSEVESRFRDTERAVLEGALLGLRGR